MNEPFNHPYDIVAIGKDYDILHDKITGYIYKRTANGCVRWNTSEGEPMTYQMFKQYIKELRSNNRTKKRRNKYDVFC